MINLNLPQDLMAFLKENNQLKYDYKKVEPGKVTLKSYSDLKVGVVWINSNESPLINDDPHSGEKGYYEVPAVSLISECEGYDPDYILLWLPNEQLFGTWDSDHWDLRIFNNTNWTDIVNNPSQYINAQWEDHENKYSEYLKPYPKYEFKKGMPF